MNSKLRKQKKISLIVLSQLIILFFCLGIVVFLYNTYAIKENSAPAKSILEDAVSTTSSNTEELPSDLVTPVINNPVESETETTNRTNYLKIEKISVDGDVVEGPKKNQENLMLQGFWVYPGTGTFSTTDTTTPVLFGHRQYKKPPQKETFYNLDKLVVGDKIEIGYNGKVYKYEVVNSKVYGNKDWDAIKKEDFKSIKLITCTPLGSSDYRLVVTAKMI